jgi:hypothetical protein
MSRHDDGSSVRSVLPTALTLVLVGVLAFVLRAQEPPPSPSSVAAEVQAPAAGGRQQPLAFSHRIHAGDNAIPCQLCHSYARRGPVAGIPSVQRCAQCHLTIATDKPEIVKLLKYWESKEPIPWLRVHDLPDYVRFTHKRHVLAGIMCQTCHGDVARMEAAVRTAPLTMGWCVSCHKERHGPTECLTCHY